jgi:hypothetical protein
MMSISGRVRNKTKPNWFPIAVSQVNSCFLGIRVFFFFGFLSLNNIFLFLFLFSVFIHLRFCLDMEITFSTLMYGSLS